MKLIQRESNEMGGGADVRGRWEGGHWEMEEEEMSNNKMYISPKSP